METQSSWKPIITFTSERQNEENSDFEQNEPWDYPEDIFSMSADEVGLSENSWEFWDKFLHLKLQKNDFNFLWFNFPAINVHEPCSNFQWSDCLSEDISFHDANFFEGVDFSGMEFVWKVDFSHATFHKFVNFSWVKFQKEVNFSNAKFLGGVHFGCAGFQDSTSFVCAYFAKNIIFGDAKFQKEVTFDLSTFEDQVGFARVNFHEYVSFSQAKILKDIDFEWTYFQKETNFIQTEFSGRLLFTEVKYWWSVSFHDATFSPTHRTQFTCNIKEIETQEFDFQSINFSDQTIFRNFDFSKTTFLNSRIDQIQFRECIFKKKNGRNMLLDEDSGKNFEQVENLYCQLKSNFEDKKIWQIAGDFHIGEMEMRRERLSYESKNWWNLWVEKTVLFLYKWISLYGERIWRPFIWLSGLVLLSTIGMVYFEYFTLDLQYFPKAVLTSVRTIAFQKEDNFEALKSWTKWIITFLQIVSPIILGLAALAINRKTKR